jgi:hypothetical protein
MQLRIGFTHTLTEIFFQVAQAIGKEVVEEVEEPPEQ